MNVDLTSRDNQTTSRGLGYLHPKKQTHEWHFWEGSINHNQMRHALGDVIMTCRYRNDPGGLPRLEAECGLLDMAMTRLMLWTDVRMDTSMNIVTVDRLRYMSIGEYIQEAYPPTV